MFGEGLRVEIEKRNSMVISYLRRVPFHLSPLTYYYQLRNFEKYKRDILIKTSVIVFIIAILLIPVPKSLYELDSQGVFAHVEELLKDKYEGRMMGTKGIDEASRYIENQLNEYGIEPYYNGEYVESLKSSTNLVELNSRLFIKDTTGVLKEYKYKTDYSLNQITDGTVSGIIITHEQYENGEYDNYNDYFILTDENVDFRALFRSICRKRFIKGILITNKLDGDSFEEQYGKRRLIRSTEILNDNHGAVVCTISKKTGEDLKSNLGKEIILLNQCKLIENIYVKNIGGIIKSNNKENNEKIMVITNYDYLGIENKDVYKGLSYNGTSIAAVLEIAEALNSLEQKPNKDIVFMFFDGSQNYALRGGVSQTGAHLFERNNKDKIDENTFIIALNDLGYRGNDKLYLDTSRASSSDMKYFEYIKYVKKRSKELNVDLFLSQLILGFEDINELNTFGGKGIFIKAIDTSEFEEHVGTKQDDITLINQKNLKNQTQLILDTIINIAY